MNEYKKEVTLGDKIKQARLHAKLSQNELGKLLGVGRTSVSLWESNARNPRFDMLKEIIRVTRVEPEFFLEVFESDFYFTEEEKVLMKNIHKKTSASVDLTDVTKYRDTELTKEEIQKIIDYTDLLLAARK